MASRSVSLPALLSVLLVLACSHAFAAPSAAGPGLIRQGRYLLCGDDKAALNLLYDGQPLIHGMGIYCGLNGYTRPKDLQAKGVVREPGKVVYRGKVRGHDIVFEQTMEIAGDRVRVTIRRIGAWPEGTWGGMRILLPVGRYGGARYRADGAEHVFPIDHSRDHRFPRGLSRLECNLDDASLNVVFESDGRISIGDHRRYRAPFYVVSIGLPTGAQDTVEFSIGLPELPDGPPHRAVRWSRIGYPIAGEKFVMLEWDKGAPRPDGAARLERRGGEVVKEGSFGPTQSVDHIQGQYAAFDFTDVREPGDYRVLWSGGKTDWFPIRANVFEDRLWQATLDYFIPFEMCHADVNLGRGVTGHPKCHRDDGARVAARHKGPDGFVAQDAEGTPYAAGQHIECAVGGWHDAGDYDLNVPAQSYVTWMLALAYEEFGLERDVATLDVAGKTFVQGTPDGVADVVQQVEWGIAWLLTMQQEDGRVYNGICAENGQRRGELGKVTDGRPGTGDERLVYIDYHADCQLNFIIATAAASRVLREGRPELSARCLAAARRAFVYFRSHPEIYQPGSYVDSSFKGKERDASVIAAAAELYLTTKDEAYLGVVKELAGSLPDLKLDWPLPRQTGPKGFRYAPPFLVRLAAVIPDGDLKDILVATCRRAAKKKASQCGVQPWPFLWYHFGEWGNSGVSLSRAFDTYWLSRIAPDLLPPESVLRNMLWIYGLRPVNDTVFVIGLGYPEPQHHYSIHLQELNGYAPASVKGAVVPGMGGFWHSGVVCYMDEHGNYGHNEACVCTAPEYIFAVNAMKAMGF